MNISQAYMIAGEPEPPAEDFVDLTCVHCAGMWSSSSRGIHNAADKVETVYSKYIGHENCELLQESDRFIERYTCPNGCTNYGNSTIRHMTEAEDLSPHREWELANLIVRHDKLETELKDIEDELKNFGHTV